MITVFLGGWYESKYLNIVKEKTVNLKWYTKKCVFNINKDINRRLQNCCETYRKQIAIEKYSTQRQGLGRQITIR